MLLERDLVDDEPATGSLAATTTPTFRVLNAYESTLSDHQKNLLRIQLQRALPKFPSLAGKTITVGRVPPETETINDPAGVAHPWNFIVEFLPGESPSNMTLFHELAHLAIYERDRNGENLPRSSEEFCSLFAVAKMDPGEIFAGRIAYLGEPEAPVDQWPNIARKALDYREERGYQSHYVQYARELFEEGFGQE